MKELYGKLKNKSLFLFLLFSIAVFGFTFFNEDFALQLATLIKPDQPAGITVNAPSSGVAWQVGTTQKIIWTTTNLASGTLFDIQLVTPASSQLIAEGVTGEASPQDLIITHAVDWTVPAQLPSASSYVIKVIDKTDSPEVVGTSAPFTIVNIGLEASYDIDGLTDATDVFLLDSFAYVTTQNTRDKSPELYIFDVATPSKPALRGFVNIGHEVNRVYVRGDYAFLATNSNAGELIVVDIKNKAAPTILGQYNIPGEGNALSIAGDSTKIYVGTTKRDGAEFYALSISNPAAPVLLGSYEVGADVNGIALKKVLGRAGVSNVKYVYLATSHASKELLALNLSDPGAITEADSYNTPGTAVGQGVDYRYDRLYFTTTNNGSQPDFFIFDVHESTSMLSFKGSANLNINSTDVMVFVDRAFVSTKKDGEGLVVVDVANPAAPKELSKFNAGGMVSGVAFNGSYVFLASTNNTSEFQIVNHPFIGVPPPTITALGSSITYGTPGDVDLYGAKIPGGGYPDKLRSLIHAAVLNRGWPSLTTVHFLAQNVELKLWSAPRWLWWEDIPETPALGMGLAHSIVKTGSITRQQPPHIIVAMIGVNDYVIHNATAEEAFARYQTIISQLEGMVVGQTESGQPIYPTVLINTELCGDPGDGSCSLNKRCRSDGTGCDAPYLHKYNDLIKATYPTKYIDMDKQFVARGGNSSMFPDGVHLACQGYTIMAQVVADELAARGLAERRAYPSLPPCN